MSATWTESCTVETVKSPPHEPMCFWVACAHGYRSSAHRTVAEALAELERLHRKVPA